jgi:hypothetical protein
MSKKAKCTCTPGKATRNSLSSSISSRLRRSLWFSPLMDQTVYTARAGESPVNALVSATSIPERVEGAFSEVQDESCPQQASQSTDRTKRPDLCEVSWSAAIAALAQLRTRFTGERRVDQLSKPEEQRVPRMTPLPAAFRAFVGTCGQG